MAGALASARRGIALVASIALLGGCAQIVTRSTVEVTERPDAAVLAFGGGGEITARGVDAQWTQDGDRLTLQLAESRACTSVRHVPVMRVERIDRRTAGGAMWFEYGLGAAGLAGGLVGLIRPQAFSQASTVTPDGQVIEDTGTGYRIGGILTGLGVLLLTAAVVDTVRTRDEVRYTDAYRRETGGAVECRDPLAPLQGHTVELLVGEWSTVEPTGDAGAVRFLLPGVDDLPEDAREVIAATEAWDAAKAEADAAAKAKAEVEEAARVAAAQAEAEAAKKKGKRRKVARADADASAGGPATATDPATAGERAPGGQELGPRPEPIVVKGVLRIDSKRALAVDFVVPYEAETAKGHEGHAAVDPGPTGPIVGKGEPVSLSAAEGDTVAPKP